MSDCLRGQKQRIAIARTLPLKKMHPDPDDSTSSVDTETGSRSAAMRVLMENHHLCYRAPHPTIMDAT
jgi:ABC-type polar amino acid transport system ATPase subunit